jgi:sedoheptulokinase
MKFIGLDIGTSTLCGVIVDAATGRIEHRAVAPNAAGMSGGEAWERMQSPERVLEQMTELLGELLCRKGRIAGIGITGQMHGILYIDAEGRSASPLYTWQDGRGDQPCLEGETHASRLSRLTGFRLATGMGAVTHFYNVRNGLVPATAAGFCTIHDYVAIRLAGGKVAVTDATDGASIGLFHLGRNRFDLEKISAVGMDPALFPKVVGNGAALGTYRGTIPVFPAIGDNQASFLASIRDVDSSVLVNIGTGSQVSVYSGCRMKAAGIDTRPFPGGGYILVGAPLCGGKAYAVLRDFLADTLGIFGGVPGDDLFAMMGRIPFRQASADDLIVDTRFSGTRLDPAVRGTIANLSMDNLRVENLVRGFLRGIASELRGFYERMPAAARAGRHVLVGAGNGIRRNPLQRRILEEVFEMSLQVPQNDEEAACGAALAAAVGAGFFRDVKDAGRAVMLQ